MFWLNVAKYPAELGVLRHARSRLAEHDPHAIWACASRFSGYKALPQRGRCRRLPIMVEIDAAANAIERAIVMRLVGTPGLYKLPNLWLRYVSGFVPEALLPFLLCLPWIRRWRLGLPQTPQVDTKPPVISFPGLNVRKPILAIIDHGIAFAHRAFRRHDEPNETRIAVFWDQEVDAHAPWRRPAGLGYGRVIFDSEINAALTAAHFDEERVYRQLRYEPARHHASHGTHVLDLAAGNPNPLKPRGGSFDEWDGCASHAPIIAVQLPYRPNKDTSGAGLGVHVLDALQFIAHLVPNDQVTVVNLSDGAYGGPHDGYSMNEQAIDAFLCKHENIHLVLAAGNAGDLGLHACSEDPLAAGVRRSVHWRVRPGDATDSFSEVWFDRELEPGAVELTVKPPQGHAPVTVPLGQTWVWRPPGSLHARAAVISTTRSANRPGRPTFLVAVGATTISASGRGVPHGVWQLEIHNISADPGLKVHVWTERDQRVANDPGPDRQSRLDAQPQHDGMAIDRARTLSSLAGSGKAFVATGRFWRGKAPCSSNVLVQSLEPCYVSHGPRRPTGSPSEPDAAAPCEESPALHGLRAAANRSGAMVRMAGTSLAAPILTRRLLNWAGTGKKSASELRQALGCNVPADVTPGQEPPGSPCA